MQTQRQLLRHSSAAFLLPSLSPSPFSHYLNLPFRPNNHYPLCSAHKVWLAQLSEELTTTAITTAAAPPQEGPIELPPSLTSILAASNDSALQTAASVLLTGAFTLFLFRSLRRRAKRAKQTRLRSSAATKSLKEEAMENLKAVSKSPIKSKTPSPDQAFLGAVIAAAFGVLLYKFTTTVEYNLNHQQLSDNYSVRQITITIRTIINGLCYLATFVFGFNSLGLFLYSGQLAMNSFAEAPGSPGGAQFNSPNSESRDMDSSGKPSASEDQVQVKQNNEEQK
ncbi:hypothetical protein Salat_1989300 [Sesamum alatum]|uniref:Transmembrane protein n=1 Tax=Sesamum alatum TaxID=300844 RepID=A0AAE1XYG5_9LAMI|nr:hypothetical protein Salat_1989300 [Sesamum alatum]